MNLSPGDLKLKNINSAIRQLGAGGSNNTGTVTLNVSATSTTVSHPSVNPKSHIHLSPLTAHAASVAWYISSRTLGSFTITHPSSANSDQNFTFSITGGA